jgi:hypothetical protein
MVSRCSEGRDHSSRHVQSVWHGDRGGKTMLPTTPNNMTGAIGKKKTDAKWSAVTAESVIIKRTSHRLPGRLVSVLLDESNAPSSTAWCGRKQRMPPSATTSTTTSTSSNFLRPSVRLSLPRLPRSFSSSSVTVAGYFLIFKKKRTR